MKEFLAKIQNLPEKKRKIILWAIIVALGIMLFIFYINNISHKIKNFQGEKFLENLKIPSLQQNIKENTDSIQKEKIEENLNELKNLKQNEENGAEN